MEFKIIASGGDNLEIISGLPSGYNGLILPLITATEARADFGNMIFQHYHGAGFDIWFSNYNIAHRTVLIGRADVPMLELHIHLLSPAQTIWDKQKENILRQYQYNLTYTPFMNNESKFDARRSYQTFDIHFTLPYLHKLAPFFKPLDIFLEKVEKGIPTDISEMDRFLSPPMITIVNKLLNCKYKNGAASFFIESQVVELLLLVLDECSTENPLAPIRLTPYDIEMLHEVRNLVTQDFENPMTLMQLCRKVGINDFKLKKGFKYLFGTTVFDYMHTMRMEKAKQLLVETEFSIKDIAHMVGYDHDDNFKKAFKKRFGYTPAYLRKG